MPEEAALPEQGGDNVPKEGAENLEKVSKTPTTLDKYHEENNRREELLKQETDLQDRREKLHTEQMLGGGSDAGQAPQQKKELTDEEYKNKVMAGEVPENK